MTLGDALLFLVTPKVYDGFALFFKCVTKEDKETKEDSNGGKGGKGGCGYGVSQF